MRPAKGRANSLRIVGDATSNTLIVRATAGAPWPAAFTTVFPLMKSGILSIVGVALALVVDEQGRPQNLRVVRSLGLGLDQKAIEAVEKWRFKPGMKDGKPVAVQATIAVSFHLL